ncbi:MAG: cytochrome bd ubiquinol oxidase subunit [Streptosporangiaceae bacterium]|jgi:cytochrome d ubiquinol oxidase subunit II|nr:terminal oxidase subunit [Streptosporangiaceae bacterium]MDX6429568.1 cytochrome bd ubiquinol oxidase subunit [Streptosporangiaceae bacterium]
MSAADALLTLIWAAVTAYALLGGADFGGGVWDLFSGGARRGARRRSLIEHSIGPVWEANHVWLIFALVLTWTGFPSVFAAIASTLYIPLTLAALGIIGRGAGFAFRKVSTTVARQRLFGAVFALCSLITPFFLGAAAGGIASGRVPPGIAAGHPITSWVNPTSLVAGMLAVGVGAYLAAVFLTWDAQRDDPDLVAGFRRRAVAAGTGVGVLAAVGLVVVAHDAPGLERGLRTAPAVVLVGMSLVAGFVSLGLLSARRYLAVRLTAGLAAATVIWGWGLAEYPRLLPGLSVHEAAAVPAVLHTTLAVSVVGILLLIPSLGWLFLLFQHAARHPPRPAGSPPVPRQE